MLFLTTCLVSSDEQEGEVKATLADIFILANGFCGLYDFGAVSTAKKQRRLTF